MSRMRKLLLVIAGCIVGVAVVAGTWWGAQALLARQSSKLPQPIARLSDCAGKTFTCYYQYLRPRTINDGPAAALADIKRAAATDTYAREQCHELAHVVGAAAFERYGNLAAVLRYDDPMCEGGYKHGAEEAQAQKQGHAD